MKASVRFLVATASLVAAVLFTAKPIRAQGDVALGVFLNGLMDGVQQSIENAKNAGDDVAIEAGRQMLIVLSEARATYEDELNKTLDDLDATARGNINHLATVVQQLKAGTVTDLGDFTSQVQTIVSLLPFRDHEPKLGNVSPNFLAPSTTIPVARISFTGSFEFAARSDYSPSIIMGQRTYPVNSSTTQSLVFSIPMSEFTAAAKAGSVTFVKATLVVPWESSGFLGIFHSRENEKYALTIGVLPSVPGRIILVQQYQTHDPVVKHYQGPNHHLSSQKEGGNDDHKDVRFTDTADPGSQIIRPSVVLHKNGKCDESCDIWSIDASEVVTTATTIHHRFGCSGVVDFSIEFDESCPASQDRVDSVMIDDASHENITWGESRSYQLKPNATYTVIFDSFDGKHTEYSGPFDSPPKGFLVIGSDTHQVTIGTADPDNLIWP